MLIANSRLIFASPVYKPLSESDNLHRRSLTAGHQDRISQRPSESFELDGHNISTFQFNALTEAQRMRTKKMDVYVAGLTMQFELEMVVL